jgi:hypothetical protein
MKRQISHFLFLLAGLMGMTSVMASSPEQLVVAFQHDYKIWNDESFQNRQPDNDGNAMRIAEQNYHALLKKYTKPDFRGEPIAYGSESSHDPLREKMTAQKIEDSRACWFRRCAWWNAAPPITARLTIRRSFRPCTTSAIMPAKG